MILLRVLQRRHPPDLLPCVRAVEVLAASSIESRAWLLHKGVLSHLVTLCGRGPAVASDLQGGAALALREFAADPESRGRIRELGGLRSLVTMLGCDAQCNEAACAAIANLAVDEQNQYALRLAGALPRLLEAMVRGGEATTVHATAAVANLALDETNRTALIKAKAPELLAHLLMEGPQATHEKAAAAVWALALDPDAAAALTQRAVMQALVHLLLHGSEAAQEKAAGAIWSLAQARREAQANETQAQFLKSLGVSDTDSSLARAILSGRLQHCGWDMEHCPGPLTPVFFDTEACTSRLACGSSQRVSTSFCTQNM